MPQTNESPAGSLAGLPCNQLGGCLHEFNTPERSDEQAIPALIEMHLGREFLTSRQGGCTCEI